MTTIRPDLPPSVLLRVLVADRGVSVNDSLTALLSEFEGVSVFGCVQEPAKVLALVHTVRPDVVILDFDARGAGGLEELRRIKQAARPPVIIVLSHCAAPAARRAALAAGADHFLHKTTECARLVEILHELAQRRADAHPRRPADLRQGEPVGGATGRSQP